MIIWQSFRMCLSGKLRLMSLIDTKTVPSINTKYADMCACSALGIVHKCRLELFAYMSRRVVWEHRVPINVCFRRSRAGLAGVVIVVGNGVTLSGGIIPETRKRRRENRKPVEKKKTSTLVQRKKIKMGQFCLYSLLIIWCHTYSLTPGAET